MQPSLSKITDYPKFLNDHWALHLAPRAKDAPTVISTFAGCGGSSLGYSFAGFKELLAVEWEQNAVDTFKLNFPDVPVYHGDIAELSVEQCLEMTGLKIGELDVFDGSPPCQGFSTAGKQIMQDARNYLFREYCRLLKGLQPKVFVMENVSGMVKGKMKLIFAEILRELKSCGYKVKAVLMNAMYFGVPQSRQRIIFIGVREDIEKEPPFPLPIYQPPTVSEAIKHLPKGVAGKHEQQVLEAWRLSRPGASLRQTCHFVGSFQSIRLDPDRPSSTQIKAHLNWHYDTARQLTIKEAGIIQSFPEAFQFTGTKANGKERIGNSVPPLFMKAIAEHIHNEILNA